MKNGEAVCVAGVRLQSIADGKKGEAYRSWGRLVYPEYRPDAGQLMLDVAA